MWKGWKVWDSISALIATIADIEEIKVPFLHINHLITSKKAANRPKDQFDVIYLEKIKKLKDEMSNNSNSL